MGKTAITSPQRLRKAHRASFPVESVSWDGSQFVARCVACRLGTEVPCVKSAPSSREALGRLGHEMQPVAEGRLLHLLSHRVQHMRVGMADIADHRARRAVDEAVALGIPHVDAFGPIQNRAGMLGLIEQMRFGVPELVHATLRFCAKDWTGSHP